MLNKAGDPFSGALKAFSLESKGGEIRVSLIPYVFLLGIIWL